MISDFGFRISDLEPERPAPRAAPRRSIRNPQSAIRNGFTLTELLVVIGIIVLVAVVAVPSFRAMTGGRSTEAAQNQISAVLARARTEALGLQEVRGVMFFRDPESRRVAMAPVMPTTQAPPWALDLVPDRDVVMLPIGVGIHFIDNYASTGTPPNRTDDGYIGFNTVVNTGFTSKVPYGGVILFDGQGQLISDLYALRLRFPASGGVPVRVSEMARFLLNDPGLLPGTLPGDIAVPTLEAEGKIGFVLFDEEEFNAVHGEGRTTAANTDTDTQVSGVTGNGAYDPGEKAEEEWLDANALPVLINRFNGTLLRGE